MTKERAMAITLRTRDEVEAQYLWDTASIYPEDTRWEADFRAVEPRLVLRVCGVLVAAQFCVD